VKILEDSPELRHTVAMACRVLATRGLVEGTLGHISARVSSDEIIIRCRGPKDLGLKGSEAGDIWRVTLDGEPVDVPRGYSLPKELPLHTELMRQRPLLGAVVHAHPRSALLCGLAGLEPRPVFGAYNIPAMRLALQGIPLFKKPVLVTRPEIAGEIAKKMADADICLLLGHGVVVGGETVEQATVRTVDLNTLFEVTLRLHELRAEPDQISDADLSELPDLGSEFNDQLAWQALLAESIAT